MSKGPLYVGVKIAGWNHNPGVEELGLTLRGPRSGAWNTSMHINDAAHLALQLVDAIRQTAAAEGFTTPAYVKLMEGLRSHAS